MRFAATASYTEQRKCPPHLVRACALLNNAERARLDQTRDDRNAASAFRENNRNTWKKLRMEKNKCLAIVWSGFHEGDGGATRRILFFYYIGASNPNKKIVFH